MLKAQYRILLWTASLVLVLGAIYLTTILPGPGYSGDSTKFQFVGKALGIAHPPGYPTYTILNHLFTRFFPFGSLAYKANLLSAIFSVAASAFLFRILIQLKLSNLVAFVTSLTFGLTSTLWSQSIVAEVYSLNILFVAMTIYSLILWSNRGKYIHFLIACAIYAISFGNHLTMITLLPGMIYFILATNRKVIFRPKNIMLILIFVIIGIAQYLYIFWRSYDPHISYSEMEVENFKSFLDQVTGGSFKKLMFSFPLARVVFQRIPLFLKQFLREYFLLIPIALFGAVQLKNLKPNIFLLLCIVGSLIFSLNFDIPDIQPQFIPVYFIVAIYLGMGLERISESLAKDRIRLNPAFFLVPLLVFSVNFKSVDQHNNTNLAKEVESILKRVGSDSIIISHDFSYAECFWYYLIGNGWQRERIYIAYYYSADGKHRIDIDEIRSYLYEDRPPYLPVTPSTVVPNGLKVYCIDSGCRDLLEKAGLSTKKIQDDLYLIISKLEK